MKASQAELNQQAQPSDGESDDGSPQKDTEQPRRVAPASAATLKTPVPASMPDAGHRNPAPDQCKPAVTALPASAAGLQLDEMD